jgi:hypothetical protein
MPRLGVLIAVAGRPRWKPRRPSSGKFKKRQRKCRRTAAIDDRQGIRHNVASGVGEHRDVLLAISKART